MIPISLSIKGLYSYQNEQVINFGPLLDAHLFGIFGSVGSGKSTILEAMSFALYNNTERIKNNEGRNYNMLNLKSNELFIDFIFLNHDNDKYRFTVKGSRNKKNFEEVRAFERKAYKFEQSGQSWMPIDNTDAEQIICLSYENFRRTIIIPQDKFQEFLQLGQKERTNMLKDIFQLEKFEFYDQAAFLYAQNDQKLQLLQGRLDQLAEISSLYIEEKSKSIEKLTASLEQEKLSLKRFEEVEKESLTLKKQFDEQENKLRHFGEMEAKRPKMEALKSEVGLFEYCLIHFKDILNREYELDRSLAAKTEELRATTEKLASLGEVIQKEEFELNEVKLEFDKLEDYQSEKRDCEYLIEYLETQLKIEKNTALLIKISAELECIEAEKKESESRVVELKNQINGLKVEQSKFTDWANVQSWFAEYEFLKKQISDIKESDIKLRDRLSASKVKLQADFQGALQSLSNQVDLEKGKDFVQILIQQENDNLNESKVAQNKLEELVLQSKLAAFAEQIYDGASCPLCGSNEHPQVLHIESVEEDINNINATLSRLENEQKQIRIAQKNCEITLTEIASIEQQIEDAKQVLEAKNKDEQRLVEAFRWSQFSYNDRSQFDQAQKVMLEREKDLIVLETSLAELEVKYKLSLERYEKGREYLGLNETNQKILEHNSMLLKNKIQNKEKISWISDIDTVREEAAKINTLIEKTKSTFNELSSKNQANKIEFASAASKKSAEEKAVGELHQQRFELKERCEKSLLKSPLSSIEKVKAVLASNLNLEQSKTMLSNFENEHFSLQKELKLLAEMLDGKSFDHASFEHLQVQLSEKKILVEELNNSLISEQTILKSWLEQWESKKAIQREFDQLENRKANLKTFLGLFKSSGFVNYISSVYLQQLCEAANVRFHKLTRQQLRLELADNNTFQVRDFLNEGRLRSVKTLSGGQTFQASLCLALALAESIPQQSKAKQNFFFLDEGFGSQDRESLRIVFESLKALRQENRIVGVISHVEDLKQEIDSYLLIQNDPERGSIVKGSWARE